MIKRYPELEAICTVLPGRTTLTCAWPPYHSTVRSVFGSARGRVPVPLPVWSHGDAGDASDAKSAQIVKVQLCDMLWKKQPGAFSDLTKPQSPLQMIRTITQLILMRKGSR